MNIFQYVRPPKIRHHNFRMSYENKLTCNMAYLVPVHVEHVVPSDHGVISVEPFIRLAPTLAPIMHSIDVTFDAFFVPYRILLSSEGQQNFEKFFTGGPEGNENGAIPFINWALFCNADQDGSLTGPGSLMDYLGYSRSYEFDEMSGDEGPQYVNIWAPMAYNKIWYDYYRDQTFGDSDLIMEYNAREYELDEVADQFKLRKRAWRHDYFTSALPWAQRGNDVKIPISAEVVSNIPPEATTPAYVFAETSSAPGKAAVGGTSPSNRLRAESEGDADATTINDLRRAMALERWMEKNARGGARLGEYNYSHFGVFPDDARLQRAQYLGRRVQPIKVSEVLQTSETTENSPLGDMGGHGVSVGFHRPFKFSVKEHGVVMVLMSILPKTGYCQGINRQNLKLDRFDYFDPDFAHLGEQPVLKQELFARTGDWDGTFGYMPRYSEYKFHQSECHGAFKTSLAFWHLDRIFANEPTLSDNFILANPSERVFAVTDENVDHFFCQIAIHQRINRPMPVFGTPMI